MKEINTEDRIRAAAKEVFTRKGFAAARMQEIADAAGINKGLLHYYFQNKEKLFASIFYEAFDRFVPRVNQIFEAELPLEDKFRRFISEYIDMLIQNPYLPAFVLSEINRRPEAFVRELIGRRELPNPAGLIMQMQIEADAGRIRRISPLQAWMHVVSLCAFPFAARPMLQAIMGIDDATYLQLMEQRKHEIADFVVHALRGN